MPTYQYQCDACAYEFEQFQSITASPVKNCPKCKAEVRRLIGSGAAILFKGSGFYQTDYRSSSYQKKADADRKTATPEKKTEKKSEPSRSKEK